MRRLLPLRRRQAGFTIVELMIATSILSVILLIVSVMMISIGNLYQKGVSSSSIQDNTRAIIDELSQRIEFSDGSAGLVQYEAGDTNNAAAYCISGYRYSFITQKQVGGQSKHVLWRDNVGSGNCTQLSLAVMNSAQPTSGGVELLTPNANLQYLSIGDTAPYTITVTAAAGTPDQLSATGQSATCQGGAGSQFCSTSTLTTTVVPRLGSD